MKKKKQWIATDFCPKCARTKKNPMCQITVVKIDNVCALCSIHDGKVSRSFKYNL